MIHELRVYQIELEMQNEELRRMQGELGASQARYFDLYDLAPVGYVTVNEKGLIFEANLTAATLLGKELTDVKEQLYYARRRNLSEGLPEALPMILTICSWP